MRRIFEFFAIRRNFGLLALALVLPFVINTVEAAKPLKLPFSVKVFEHVGEGAPVSYSPLYQPFDLNADCLAIAHENRADYNGFFPYNDDNECETLLTDTGTALVDLVGFGIIKDKKTGAIISAVIQGQDHVDAELALLHVSEEMVDSGVPVEVEDLGDDGFIIHLHADDVVLYKCDTNGEDKPVCEIEAGTFAIEDLWYEYR